MRQPLLGLVTKQDHLGSCVQQSYVSERQLRFKLAFHLLGSPLTVTDTLGFALAVVVDEHIPLAVLLPNFDTHKILLEKHPSAVCSSPADTTAQHHLSSGVTG